MKPSIDAAFALRFLNQLQRRSFARYPQSSSSSTPRFSTIHSKPLSINPPLQPLFPPIFAHDTSSCSLREIRSPVFTATTPSTAPTVENAQHDPHWPWFFTGVTAPLDTQSIVSGGVTSAYSQFAASTGGLLDSTRFLDAS